MGSSRAQIAVRGQGAHRRGSVRRYRPHRPTVVLRASSYRFRLARMGVSAIVECSGRLWQERLRQKQT